MTGVPMARPIAEGRTTPPARQRGQDPGTGQHRWTEEEREVIRRGYSHTARADLAARLGVTEAALGKQLRQMAIKKFRPHRWTREEVETVCREYRNNKQSVIELAVKLR